MERRRRCSRCREYFTFDKTLFVEGICEFKLVGKLVGVLQGPAQLCVKCLTVAAEQHGIQSFDAKSITEEKFRTEAGDLAAVTWSSNGRCIRAFVRVDRVDQALIREERPLPPTSFDESEEHAKENGLREVTPDSFDVARE